MTVTDCNPLRFWPVFSQRRGPSVSLVGSRRRAVDARHGAVLWGGYDGNEGGKNIMDWPCDCRRLMYTNQNEEALQSNGWGL